MSDLEYWQRLAEWLAKQPPQDRVSWLQLAVQRKGPIPDELREQIEALIS